MQENIEKQISTERFIELLNLFKQWFADEEMEVSDFVLGRMASRLQQYEKSAVQQAKKDTAKAIIRDVVVWMRIENDISIVHKDQFDEFIVNLKSKYLPEPKSEEK